MEVFTVVTGQWEPAASPPSSLHSSAASLLSAPVDSLASAERLAVFQGTQRRPPAVTGHPLSECQAVTGKVAFKI